MIHFFENIQHSSTTKGWDYKYVVCEEYIEVELDSTQDLVRARILKTKCKEGFADLQYLSGTVSGISYSNL